MKRKLFAFFALLSLLLGAATVWWWTGSGQRIDQLSLECNGSHSLRLWGSGGKVLLTGGLALDTGLLAAIQEEMLNEKVNLNATSHPDSIYAGAIGAALWGAFRHERLQDLQTRAAA